MRPALLLLLGACVVEEVPDWTPTAPRARHCLDWAPSADTGADTGDNRPWVDVDCDGYPAPADCDDRDPYINPSRPELLNGGIDDDCQGGPERVHNCGYTGGALALLPLLTLRRRREQP